MKDHNKVRGAYPGISRWMQALGLLLLVCMLWKHPAAGAEGTIAVASDLHLNPENQYAGVSNPLVLYNVQIAEALFADVIRQEADLLLLLGDLTDDGGERQHEELIRMMEAAKEMGVQTYVLPGNHDLGEDEADLFAERYGAFGFSEALSRDTDSLSYSLLREDLLILMLDTDGYSPGANGANVSEITLGWIEDQLKEAQNRELQVLAAGHYPLLTDQATEFTRKEELIALFETYQVPLYLCGHLHQRNVAYKRGLTELVTDQVTMYPCSYALLYNEGENTWRYSPEKVDVDTWAGETGQTQEELLHFSEYEEKVSIEKSEEVIRLLKGNQLLSEKKTRQAAEFFRQVQEEYLQGTLPAHKEEICRQAGYKAFMKIAEDTTYGRWIPELIEKAGPYTAGFLLRDGLLITTRQRTG